MEKVKRWAAASWRVLLGGVRVVDKVSRVMLSVVVLVVLGVVAYVQWDNLSGAAAEREALRVAERAEAGAKRDQFIAERAKAVRVEACACGDGGRCTGPRGGSYCLKADGSKRYF